MADIKLSHNLEESKIINFSRDNMTKLCSLTNIKKNHFVFLKCVFGCCLTTSSFYNLSAFTLFLAPEVVSFEPLSLATDMWSVGVITYIL